MLKFSAWVKANKPTGCSLALMFLERTSEGKRQHASCFLVFCILVCEVFFPIRLEIRKHHMTAKFKTPILLWMTNYRMCFVICQQNFAIYLR